MVVEFARQNGLTGGYSGLRSSVTPLSATLGRPKPWQIRFRVVWQRCILTPVLLIAPRSRLNSLYAVVYVVLSRSTGIVKRFNSVP